MFEHWDMDVAPGVDIKSSPQTDAQISGKEAKASKV